MTPPTGTGITDGAMALSPRQRPTGTGTGRFPRDRGLVWEVPAATAPPQTAGLDGGRLEPWRDAFVVLLVIHAVYITASVAWSGMLADVVLTTLLSVGVAAGAMIVLHDAMHRRFSTRYWWVNSAVVHIALPFGLAVERRSRQHLAIHHPYPGVYPIDDFTTAGRFVRPHTAAPWRRWHRWQHYYVWFGYALVWLVDQVSQLEAIVDAAPRRDGWDDRPRTVLLACYFLDHAASVVVLGPYVALMGPRRFALVTVPALVIGGLITSVTLAVGHISDGLDPATAPQLATAVIDRAWRSTASFSVGNDALSWLTGGLTRHLAHHVFPDAPRRHLRTLHHQLTTYVGNSLNAGPVVHPGAAAAVAAHYRKLRQLGTSKLSATTVPTPGRQPALPVPNCFTRAVGLVAGKLTRRH